MEEQNGEQEVQTLRSKLAKTEEKYAKLKSNLVRVSGTPA